MIFLGLDPGIGRTGFGIIDTSQPQPFIRCGCLTTPARDPLPERLYSLARDIDALVQEYQPQHAAVEDIFFGTNTATAMLTAHARGVLLYALCARHVPITSFTPLQIKSRLTGYGRADKEQVRYLVMQRLHLGSSPQPDDAADALAAALCLADSIPENGRTSYTASIL